MNTISTHSSKILVLNKPKGYLVTRSDDMGRKTVYDLLPTWAMSDGWMPIGRLDLDSKGLLLFTTDGQINNTLTKPQTCIKTYEIWVRGYVTDVHIAMAIKGIKSKNELLKALSIKKIGTGGAKTKLHIQIDEGKNRHIRRLFGSMRDPKFDTPLKVLELKRIAIGEFTLDIDSGEWRFLSLDEANSLIQIS